MARKTASRIQKRKEAEAASSRGAKATAKKKKVKRARATTRRKPKVAERKRVIWGIFTGSLKEEARFPYDQRTAAEERLEQLRAKGKKNYFIQAIKEPIPAAEAASTEAADAK